MTLSEYVYRRNGVRIGDNRSLKNMLYRSLGAGEFSSFWKFWNPIWGYYLGKYVFKPLKGVLPKALALILTFVFSGFIHDLAIMVIRKEFTLLLTPWFLFMGICIVLTEFVNLDYSRFSWIIRAIINVLIISSCLFLAYQVKV